MRPDLVFMGIVTLSLGTVAAPPAVAASAASADYTMASRAVLPGASFGMGSASYSLDAMIEWAQGTRSSSPSYLQQSGFVPALVRVDSVVVEPTGVPEAASVPVAVDLLLDDGTSLPAVGNSLVHSITEPLSSVDLNLGRLTTVPVAMDTLAELTLTSSDGPHSVRVRVLDSEPDNFGSYAGDGLPDSWQTQYFGVGNPSASPVLDPDGDAQDNEFEFIAGLNPTNSVSRLVFSLQRVAGGADEVRLNLEPVVAGRRYRVESSSQLTAQSWETVFETEPNGPIDNESLTLVLPARGPALFLRVRVERIR